MARPCEIDADGFCTEHGNDCEDFQLHIRQQTEQPEETETQTEGPRFIEVVNWYGSRRHLATPKGHPTKGQIKTFCPNTWGQTFEAHAKRISQFSNNAVDYDALPMCRTCAKLAGIDPGAAPESPKTSRAFRVESMEKTGWRWWGTFSSVEKAHKAVTDAGWKPGAYRIVNRLTKQVVFDPFDD